MNITRISVGRLPGIDRPFEIKRISPGLNIILGPNGAGKSSICRAVRQSLWPPQIPPEKTRVRIVWNADGSELISELEAGVVWQSSGMNVPAPEVAPGHLARCYTVTLRDLLEDKHPDDKKLAEDIRILMAGGYDLPAVKKRFQLKKSHGRSEARELNNSVRALEKLRVERRTLSEDEDRLISLQKDLDAARIATRECGLLTVALELAAKRKELISLKSEIGAFPAGMEGLGGNERNLIREVEDEIAELEENISLKNHEIEEARLDLSENELPDGDTDESSLRAMGERVHRLERLARERGGKEEELQRCQGVLRETEAVLGVQAKDQPESCPAELRLDEVDLWARKAIRLKDRRLGIETSLAALLSRDEISGEDVDRIRRGGDILADWLSCPGGPTSPSPWLNLIRLAAAGAGMAGGVLAFLIDPWFILLGGLGFGVLLMSLFPGNPEGDQRALLREQFEKLELPPISSWQRSDVRDRLNELIQKRGRVEKILADGLER